MVDFNKRKDDDNPLKKLYDWASPWVQLLGFIILCAFTIGTKSERFDAYGATLQDHDKRLMALENKADLVNQKLDDMIAFFRVPHKE